MPPDKTEYPTPWKVRIGSGSWNRGVEIFQDVSPSVTNIKGFWPVNVEGWRAAKARADELNADMIAERIAGITNDMLATEESEG